MSTVGSRFWRKFRHEKSWCLHDLRRVLATNLNDMGVDPHVVEQLFGIRYQGLWEFTIVANIWRQNLMH
jgi:hypothetical protein